MASLVPTASPLAALREGAQTADMLTGAVQRGAVNRLYSQSFGGDASAQQAARQQAAQFGPEAAQALSQAQTADLDAKGAEVVRAARFLSAIPQAGRAAAYAQIRPQLEQVTGQQFPAEYDEDADDYVEAIIETYGAGEGGDELKSLRVGQDGNFYAIRGGQLVNTGIQAAQNLRPLDLGQAGFVGFDPRTGQAAPVTQQQAPNRFRNAAGEVMDVSQVEDPAVRQQIIANPEAFGLMAETGGSVELPPQAAPIRRVEAITPYQQAQLAAGARDDARADAAAADAAAARRDAAEARRAVNDEKSRKARQAIDVRAAQLNDVRRGVQRVRQALDALDQSRIGTGPVAQFSQQYMEAGQELETAVNAMNNSMLALTRVPGMGAQSDLEARIAGMRFPQLNREESVNRRTLQDLEAFVNELAGTARSADAEDRQQIEAAPAAGSDVDDLLEKYR